MTQPAYMSEAWFAVFSAAVQSLSGRAIAKRLGVSPGMVSQVVNGTGFYGTGAASTTKFAQLVVHQLGSFVCPYLTEQYGAERTVSAAECRAYAHRSAPTSSPGALNHWKACRACPHKALSAPPQPRAVVPRGRKGEPEHPQERSA